MPTTQSHAEDNARYTDDLKNMVNVTRHIQSRFKSDKPQPSMDFPKFIALSELLITWCQTGANEDKLSAALRDTKYFTEGGQSQPARA